MKKEFNQTGYNKAVQADLKMLRDKARGLHVVTLIQTMAITVLFYLVLK